MENNDETKKKTNKQFLIKGSIIFSCIIIFIITIGIRIYNTNKVKQLDKGYEGNHAVIWDFGNFDSNSYSIISDEKEYDELKKKILEDDSTYEINKKELEKYDSEIFKSKSLLVLNSNETFRLYSVVEQGNKVNIELEHIGRTMKGTALIPQTFIIPVSKNIIEASIGKYKNEKLNIASKNKQTMAKITYFIDGFAIIVIICVIVRKDTKKAIITAIIISIILFGFYIFMASRPERIELKKPIIYLYPTQEQQISVKLNKPYNITCSYPKYTDGWNVIAKPNGDLINTDNNKYLYALYYESKSDKVYKIEKQGFCVESEDVASFLEEKLAILGLNKKETEEFIIYWLPELEKNEYNYIRFATEDEINENMPLEITPKPDTIIRILMTYKGLKKHIKVEEQQLPNIRRNGFTVVEWGGTEI